MSLTRPTSLERHRAGYVAVKLTYVIDTEPLVMNLWTENAEEYRKFTEAVRALEFQGFEAKYFTLSRSMQILSVEKKVVE